MGLVNGSGEAVGLRKMKLKIVSSQKRTANTSANKVKKIHLNTKIDYILSRLHMWY